MKKLIGNGVLVTLNEKNDFYENGAIVFENDKILDYGDYNEMSLKYKDEGYEFIDAKKGLIMPGLINAHHHLYSAMARGMDFKNSENPTNFVEILEKVWWKLDKKLTLEDVYYNGMIGLIDCIRMGATTVIDHHASPYHAKNSLFELYKAFKHTGLRGALCYEISDRDGKDITNKGLEETEEFIKFAKEDKSGMVAALVGLHASFTVDDDTLDKASSLMNKYNVGSHIHVAEDFADREDSIKRCEKPTILRLNDHNILSDNSIFAHCIHIDDDEMKLLKDKNVFVAHNPQSNMNNAVGCADVDKLLDMNINVCLGTDGFTSNMLESLKTAYILHKFNKKDSNAFGFDKFYKLPFDNNQKLAKKLFNKTVGVIEKDAVSDIIVMNYTAPTPLNANNFLGHLIFGICSNSVRTTICNGQVLMKDYEILILDEQKILERARKATQKLWDNI